MIYLNSNIHPQIYTQKTASNLEIGTGTYIMMSVNIKPEGGYDLKAGNIQGSTDFVKKLFQMLGQDRYSSIVRWTKGGESFVVLDTNEFTKEILPKHFKHSNFSSFVRQLNKYDFHKVKLSNSEKLTKDYVDGAWEFKHPDFKRDNKESLENIKRKGPVQKRTNLSEQSQEVIVSLRRNVQNLNTDNAKMFEELKAIKSKYNNVVETLMQLKMVNDKYRDSLATLINCVANSGIEVPTLDLPLVTTSLSASPINQAMVSDQQRSGSHNPAAKKQPKSHRQNALGEPEPGLVTNIFVNTPASVAPASAAVTAAAAGPDSVTSNGSIMIANPPSELPPPFQGSFHVLLVEDDVVCIQLCRRFLVKYGCTVEILTDGLAAISTVNTKNYDLVLMDIVMPNLDGASATSIIRRYDSTTPIIAMTGNIKDDDLMAYLRHGMSDILAKPFTKEDLYLILEKHLKQRTPVAQQRQGLPNQSKQQASQQDTVPQQSRAKLPSQPNQPSVKQESQPQISSETQIQESLTPPVAGRNIQGSITPQTPLVMNTPPQPNGMQQPGKVPGQVQPLMLATGNLNMEEVNRIPTTNLPLIPISGLGQINVIMEGPQTKKQKLQNDQ